MIPKLKLSFLSVVLGVFVADYCHASVWMWSQAQQRCYVSGYVQESQFYLNGGEYSTQPYAYNDGTSYLAPRGGSNIWSSATVKRTTGYYYAPNASNVYTKVSVTPFFLDQGGTGQANLENTYGPAGDYMGPMPDHILTEQECSAFPPTPECEPLTGTIDFVELGSDVNPGDELCISQCQGQAYVPDGGGLMSLRVDGRWYTQVLFTGEPCAGSEQSPLPHSPCSELEEMCATVCEGDLSGFQCEETGGWECGCELPPFPLVDNPDTGRVEPDQDNDGIGSGSDPDVDGDGTPNGPDDSDIDGDGKDQKGDNDNDGDAIGNGGDYGWDPPRGNANGLGADPDVDGDGTANGSDNDVDGDGIPNGSDPDIDGDGVPNGSDGDADGDGIPNGSDGDADGDGLIGGDDPDGDGSSIGSGDTDGDGDIDGEDDPAADEDPPGVACPDGAVCVGDGTCQAGESPTSADCAGNGYLGARVGEFVEIVSDSPIFGLMDAVEIPEGGSSEYTADFGNTFGGSKSFDLENFAPALLILRIVVFTAFLWTAFRIVTLKR